MFSGDANAIDKYESHNQRGQREPSRGGNPSTADSVEFEASLGEDQSSFPQVMALTHHLAKSRILSSLSSVHKIPINELGRRPGFISRSLFHEIDTALVTLNSEAEKINAHHPWSPCPPPNPHSGCDGKVTT